MKIKFSIGGYGWSDFILSMHKFTMNWFGFCFRHGAKSVHQSFLTGAYCTTCDELQFQDFMKDAFTK